MTRGIALRSIPILGTLAAFGVLGTLGGCAGSLTSVGRSTSPSPAPDVFACIRQQIKAVGFSQESYDEGELRVTAHKYDENARRPDTRFSRLVDRVSFDVDPSRDSASTRTTVTAQASTFGEYSTHRGPTEQQEKTSQTAKDAARTIMGHCAPDQP